MEDLYDPGKSLDLDLGQSTSAPKVVHYLFHMRLHIMHACIQVNQKGQKIRDQKNIAMVCKLNTLEITLYAGLVICTLASGDKALKKPCIQIFKNIIIIS